MNIVWKIHPKNAKVSVWRIYMPDFQTKTTEGWSAKHPNTPKDIYLYIGDLAEREKEKGNSESFFTVW